MPTGSRRPWTRWQTKPAASSTRGIKRRKLLLDSRHFFHPHFVSPDTYA
jgi:hypothetical protein